VERLHDRAALHLVIVDPDDALAGDGIRRQDELLDQLDRIGVRDEVARSPVHRPDLDPALDGGRIHPEPDVEARRGPVADHQGLEGAGHDLAHIARRNVVPSEDLEELREVCLTDIEEHPLLRLGDPNLPRQQPRLAQRDAVEMEDRAEASGVHELAGSAREPPSPEVLAPPNDPGIVRLEAGVDERLLHDRVAELDGAA